MPVSFEQWLDKSFRSKSFEEILDASPAALKGVSESDAERLHQSLGIRSVRDLADNRYFTIAQTLLATSRLSFDPGPPPKYEAIFRAAPDLGAMRPDRFREEFGPVMYRGRLDGTARILLIGQDPSTDETLVRRAFVGFSGQRVQGLLEKLGISRSYVMVNTLHFGIHDQFDREMERISASEPVLGFRNALLDELASDNKLEAVITIGAGARKAAALWPGAANHPVFELVHPSAPVSTVLPNWNQNLPALRQAIRPDDGIAPRMDNYGTDFRPEDLADIPRFDLPFGTPPWHGSGGRTRSFRNGNRQITWEAP